MQFTKAEGYGILGLIYLAAKPPKEITPLSEIAREENVPEKFLAKIFQNLTKTGIVRSHRGVHGGFSFVLKPNEVSVKTVVESIQGPYHLAKCIIDDNHCDKTNTCPVKIVLQKAEAKMLEVFERYTLDDLVKWKKRLKNGQPCG